MLTVQTLKNKGFTLVELMIVIAVIAILSALAFFGLRTAQASARDVARVKLANQVRASLEQYYSDKGTYPTGAGVGDTFGNMVATMALPASTIVDPGCGTGTRAFTAQATNWSPAPTGACTWGSQPVYSYTSTGATNYTLTLTKEGGSTQTFTNP